ncbi:MAG: hypothetical protein IJQ36_02115 [Oscillospiraceae bacterium]|nr:hypothetical protein [Oscillospiraceae bacterium]
MGLEIRAEALSLLLGAALGVGLGLLYDLLRPMRHRFWAAFWDLLFCLCAAAAAFLFAMRAENGVLGTGELLLCLAGLLLYLRLLSPLLLPWWEKRVTKIGVILQKAQANAKKVPEIAKKLFQNRRE